MHNFRCCPRCKSKDFIKLRWCHCGFRFDASIKEKLWRIEPYFYQGNLLAALNDDLLKSFNIDVVISLITQKQSRYRGLDNWIPGVKEHYRFDLHDGVNLGQIDTWKKCIETAINCITASRRTFIHCTAGISRSGIATAIIYAKLHSLDVEEAVSDINASYGIIGRWNPKLFEFLKEIILSD
jgi:hypothetical protein